MCTFDVRGQDACRARLDRAHRIRQVRLDYQVTLLLVDGPYNNERASGLLQIEAPFQLDAEGQSWTIDPGDKTTHSPICRLLHLQVRAVAMDDDETLQLEFDDGSTVTVERDAQYESWHLTDTGVPPVLVAPKSLP